MEDADVLSLPGTSLYSDTVSFLVSKLEGFKHFYGDKKELAQLTLSLTRQYNGRPRKVVFPMLVEKLKIFLRKDTQSFATTICDMRQDANEMRVGGRISDDESSASESEDNEYFDDYDSNDIDGSPVSSSRRQRKLTTRDMWLCVAEGDQAILQDILDFQRNVNLDWKNPREHKRTALHMACLSPRQNAREIVKAICEMGANPNCRDDIGRTPMHYCASVINENVFLIINTLQTFGANINIRDHVFLYKHGATPLHVAVCNDNFEAVVALLYMNADPHILGDIAPYYEKSPFQIARERANRSPGCIKTDILERFEEHVQGNRRCLSGSNFMYSLKPTDNEGTVETWVKSLGHEFSEYGKLFHNHGVDGAMLYNLTREDLLAIIGDTPIKRVHIKKIMIAIKLLNDCQPSEKKAKTRDYDKTPNSSHESSRPSKKRKTVSQESPRSSSHNAPSDRRDNIVWEKMHDVAGVIDNLIREKDNFRAQIKRIKGKKHKKHKKKH